mmetsp:Transcript_28066/g.47073  ORF Transcript_28066/g.47073 Transcript_28066/m.47073 type:complete len:127 (+) Transcript_28066:296-676(+)
MGLDQSREKYVVLESYEPDKQHVVKKEIFDFPSAFSAWQDCCKANRTAVLYDSSENKFVELYRRREDAVRLSGSSCFKFLYFDDVIENISQFPVEVVFQVLEESLGRDDVLLRVMATAVEAVPQEE